MMTSKEKYLVVSTDPHLDAKVSPRFGHAKFYLIVEPETMEFVSIPGVSQDEPSPGIGQFATEGLSAVISANIGPGAFADIQASGLRAYICRGMTVREAVEGVRTGEIAPATDPTLERSIQEIQAERASAKKEPPVEEDTPEPGAGRREEGRGLGPGGGLGLGRGAGGGGRGLGPGGGRGRGAAPGGGRGLGPGGGRGRGGGRR